MKIRLVIAELFHTDGRTDMTKLVVAFRDVANAPKNLFWIEINFTKKYQNIMLSYY